MAALSSNSNNQHSQNIPPPDSSSAKNGAIWSKLRRLSSLAGRGGDGGDIITTEGFLFKMKRSAQVIKLSDWNRRYFTIEGDYLCWRHANDRSKPSGSVKISDIKGIKTIKQNKCAFVVKAGERTLYLRSETAGDADRWVRSIQMQVDLRTGGTSQGPKGEKNQRRSNGGMDKFDHMIREVEKSLEVLEKLDEESLSSKKKPRAKKGVGGGGGGRGVSPIPVSRDREGLVGSSDSPRGGDPELEHSNGSFGSVGSGRKGYSGGAKASPSASESSESHSPSGFNTVDYKNIKRGGAGGSSKSGGVSMARPANSPPERNRNKKQSMRKDHSSTPTMKNSGGRRSNEPASPDFSSPSSIVTSTMSEATPYSPIVTSKKKKKRDSGSSRGSRGRGSSSSQKKRDEWERFESSGEFSASFESEELNESPLKPKNLGGVGVGGRSGGQMQLEEFEDLEGERLGEGGEAGGWCGSKVTISNT
ncbi:hypothetical protein TL16_g00234 [Triparma laevis f. inornata]|uniref:PH domain-containing protein n=1 Tax=Triparma laevis f. inornata TaxID=1714386 RepID=A0A9W6Z9I8_9STRA|nr:hypothetical protein TL16_g00234 [Triparma laevis f. inornata]